MNTGVLDEVFANSSIIIISFEIDEHDRNLKKCSKNHDTFSYFLLLKFINLSFKKKKYYISCHFLITKYRAEKLEIWTKKFVRQYVRWLLRSEKKAGLLFYIWNQRKMKNICKKKLIWKVIKRNFFEMNQWFKETIL